MEKWKRRAFDLVASLILGGKRELSVVPYYPQKTEACGREDNYFKELYPRKKAYPQREYIICYASLRQSLARMFTA